MKILLCFFVLILVGCEDGSRVWPNTFRVAEEKCAKNEGVKYMLVYDRNQEGLRDDGWITAIVECNNGASFRL